MMDVLRERCDEYASASLLRTPVIDAVDASEGSLFKGAGHADDNDGRLGHRQVGFFQVQGVDTGGQVVVRRQLKRRYALPFFQKPLPCLVGVEACGSAHYWSRELEVSGSYRAVDAAAYAAELHLQFVQMVFAIRHLVFIPCA
jgi:hypothetical protein